jgi:hypothetical protein
MEGIGWLAIVLAFIVCFASERFFGFMIALMFGASAVAILDLVVLILTGSHLLPN